ncbi:MAG: OsmC family peroxiredoxin [Flavobacteriaceae bacterium TMED206]|nr:MAG: OsmC family peroxiredoxin [Flavobacteriaceae bacterium TMED206]|tara:strand:+ start:130 stop:534 length:405 start_codon:yes stop_codon:yes gene_type:complete
MTSIVNYLGNLRTESVHISSNDMILTDAPTDNNGKGEAFSPTDLVATSLSSCILTVIGIISKRIKYDLVNTKSSVKKIMSNNPRRIVEIVVKIEFSQSADSKTRSIIEKTALNCPVSKSLHPDIKQNISFIWPN